MVNGVWVVENSFCCWPLAESDRPIFAETNPFSIIYFPFT
jgi:hypothetical protein